MERRCHITCNGMYKKIARHLLMINETSLRPYVASCSGVISPIISQKGRKRFHSRIKGKVAVIVPMEITVSK